jgi:hypothetical protein
VLESDALNEALRKGGERIEVRSVVWVSSMEVQTITMRMRGIGAISRCIVGTPFSYVVQNNAYLS